MNWQLLLGVATTLVWAVSLPTIASPQEQSKQPVDTARQRYALIVGNDDYPDAPLRNARNDALALSAALRELGFRVTTVVDVKQAALEQAVNEFVTQLRPGATALVFYAGHGMQIEGENLLIPVDFKASDDVEARRQSYSVERIEKKVAARGVALQILILDACRINPFRSSRSAQRGLAPMGSSRGGTVIAFATQPDGVAGDNPQGRNGVFTAALLDAIFDSQLEIEQLFSHVRERVHSITNGQQTPWMTSSRLEAFWFLPRNATTQADKPASEEVAFWNAANRVDIDSPELLQAYLDQFPRGRFSTLARIKLRLLADRSMQAAVAPRPQSRPSVVIGSFENLTSKPEFDYIGAAVAVSLGNDLAATEEVLVLPGEAGRRTQPSTPSLTARVRATASGTRTLTSRADFLITGSFLTSGTESGNQIRVDVRVSRPVGDSDPQLLTQTGSVEKLVDLVGSVGTRVRQLLGVSNRVSPAVTATAKLIPDGERGHRLYADALKNMENFEYLKAKDQLLELTGLQPEFAPAHAALSEAWYRLGFDRDARESADRAQQLAASLPREQGRWIEALYFSMTPDWPKAIALYETLAAVYEDNIFYLIKLAEVQLTAGQPQAALATIERIRGSFPDTGNDSRIEGLKAEALLATSEYRGAQSAAEKAATMALSAGVPLIAARARLAEGLAWSRLNNFDNAVTSNEEALKLYTVGGDRSGVAAALIQRGADLASRKRYQEAAKDLEQAIAITRAIGDRRRLGAALTNLGTLEYHQNRLTEAGERYREALSVVREVGDKGGTAKALLNIATVLYDQGADTAEYDREALQLMREIGYRRGVALQLSNMGEASLDRGQLQLAKAMYEEAVQINESLANESEIAYALYGLATVLYWQGRLADARTTLRRVVAARLTLSDTVGVLESQLLLARVALAETNCRESVELAQLVVNQAPLEDQSLRVQARAVLIEGLTCTGQLSQARGLVGQTDGEEQAGARSNVFLAKARARYCTALSGCLETAARVREAQSIARSVGSKLLSLLVDILELELLPSRGPEFAERLRRAAQEAAEAGAGLLVADVARIRGLQAR